MPAMEKKNPECDVEFSQIILTAVKSNQTFCVLNSAPAPSVDDLNGSWQRVMEKNLYGVEIEPD
jgi:hypothetical protein